MAFDSKNLAVLSYANGFTFWYYSSTDPQATVSAANYFDPAFNMMKAGDLIMTNTDTSAVMASRLYRVSARTGSVVTIAAL